jgi:hypothetical protein
MEEEESTKELAFGLGAIQKTKRFLEWIERLTAHIQVT